MQKDTLSSWQFAPAPCPATSARRTCAVMLKPRGASEHALTYQLTGQKTVTLGGVKKLALLISDTQTGYNMGGLSESLKTDLY